MKFFISACLSLLRRLFSVLVLLPLLVKAEPCILAYPNGNAVFQYDPERYTLIYPGDSLYNPQYDRYGAMLWDTELGRIAYELYQAPGLQGFEPGYFEKNVFNLPGNTFTLYIDGFYHAPRRVNDIYIHFQPDPPNAEPVIYVNDQRVVGLAYYIPKLIVSTPVDNGFFSDKMSLRVTWSGARAMKITAFSDKNRNRIFDGRECYSIYMTDQTIPTTDTTWGAIKAKY